jgi:hypothetical protein
MAVLGGDMRKVFDLSHAMCEGDADEAAAFAEWLRLRTSRFLNKTWFQVEAVAAALVDRQKLSGAQFRKVIAAANDDRFKPRPGSVFDKPVD